MKPFHTKLNGLNGILEPAGGSCIRMASLTISVKGADGAMIRVATGYRVHLFVTWHRDAEIPIAVAHFSNN